MAGPMRPPPGMMGGPPARSMMAPVSTAPMNMARQAIQSGAAINAPPKPLFPAAGHVSVVRLLNCYSIVLLRRNKRASRFRHNVTFEFILLCSLLLLPGPYCEYMYLLFYHGVFVVDSRAFAVKLRASSLGGTALRRDRAN